MEIWKEVERDEVSCVDPLTVAVNDRGKKRVCIDLSRYVNDFVSAAKFRIESTLQFLQVVKIETGREHWGFLGLALKIDGVKRFFVFYVSSVSSQQRDMRAHEAIEVPFAEGREWRDKAFIHLDDGIGAMSGEKLSDQKIRREAGVQVVRSKMLYSDAGGSMAGGCMIIDKKVCEDLVFQVNLSEEEVVKSSIYRELRGIKEGIKALVDRIGGKGVKGHCDNWSACKIVEYGSRKKDCHEVVKRISDLIRQFDVDFEIMWQRMREDKGQGILLVPDWSGSMIAREIRHWRQLELVGKMRPVFKCLGWFHDSTFRGVPKFDMLVYRMRC